MTILRSRAAANGGGSYEDYSRKVRELELEHPISLRHILDLRSDRRPLSKASAEVGLHSYPIVISSMSFGSQGEVAYRAYAEAVVVPQRQLHRLPALAGIADQHGVGHVGGRCAGSSPLAPPDQQAVRQVAHHQYRRGDFPGRPQPQQQRGAQQGNRQRPGAQRGQGKGHGLVGQAPGDPASTRGVPGAVTEAGLRGSRYSWRGVRWPV